MPLHVPKSARDGRVRDGSTTIAALRYDVCGRSGQIEVKRATHEAREEYARAPDRLP